MNRKNETFLRLINMLIQGKILLNNKARNSRERFLIFQNKKKKNLIVSKRKIELIDLYLKRKSDNVFKEQFIQSTKIYKSYIYIYIYINLRTKFSVY